MSALAHFNKCSSWFKQSISIDKLLCNHSKSKSNIVFRCFFLVWNQYDRFTKLSNSALIKVGRWGLSNLSELACRSGRICTHTTDVITTTWHFGNFSHRPQTRTLEARTVSNFKFAQHPAQSDTRSSNSDMINHNFGAVGSKIARARICNIFSTRMAHRFEKCRLGVCPWATAKLLGMQP